MGHCLRASLRCSSVFLKAKKKPKKNGGESSGSNSERTSPEMLPFLTLRTYCLPASEAIQRRRRGGAETFHVSVSNKQAMTASQDHFHCQSLNPSVVCELPPLYD